MNAPLSYGILILPFLCKRIFFLQLRIKKVAVARSQEVTQDLSFLRNIGEWIGMDISNDFVSFHLHMSVT